MPPTTGAHCLGIGCDHAGSADGATSTALQRPVRRGPTRRAGRNAVRRAARRALLLTAAGVK